jgi:hypothetical protein
MLKISSNISSGILLQVAPPSSNVTHGLLAMWMSDWLLNPGTGAALSFTVSCAGKAFNPGYLDGTTAVSEAVNPASEAQ